MPGEKVIRVLVVDDSVFMRSMLRSALSSQDDIEVVATAQNGQEGLKKIEQHSPDVVTLDIEMPGITGLEVLETIMQKKPMPIVMVSTKTQAGAKATLDAMRLGAVDYVAKPLGDKSTSLESFRTKIVDTVRAAAASNRATLGKNGSALGNILKPETDSCVDPNIVIGIGISTGGPATLHKLIPCIPKNFPAMVVTQHMLAEFTGPFAKRLNAESKVEVKEASEGDKLIPGRVLIAPGDKHVQVRRRAGSLIAHIDTGPKVSGFRPSVDVLFESLASTVGSSAIGVVMTGMGFDGAVGVRMLKEQGGITIAQDQETSIVYGMPKAAAETGFVDHIVPLNDILRCLERSLKKIKVSQPALG